MATSLVADLESYTKDDDSRDYIRTTDKFNQIDDDEVSETFISGSNIDTVEIEEKSIEADCIFNLINCGANNVKLLKRWTDSLVSKLHPIQRKGNKRLIVSRKEKELFVCHARKTRGTVEIEELYTGKRIDEDSVLSYFKITEKSYDRYEVKYDVTSTIENLFGDEIDSEKPKEIKIYGEGKKDYDYNVRFSFQKEKFYDYYDKNIVSFSDREFTIRDNTYEFNSSTFKGDTCPFNRFIKKIKKDHVYGVLEAEKRYKDIDNDSISKETLENVTVDGENKNKKSGGAGKYCIYSKYNNWKISEDYANTIIEEIGKKDSTIYYPGHRFEIDPLILGSGDNKLRILNLESNDNISLLEEIYDRICDSSDEFRSLIYSVLLLHLIPTFYDTIKSQSLKKIAESSNIKINEHYTEIQENAELEYKIGKAVLENNYEKIHDTCINKLELSESCLKIIVWGIADNNQIVGLDKNNVEEYVRNKLNDPQPDFEVEGNHIPDSDYLNKLEKQLENEDIVDRCIMFSPRTKRGKILVSILKQNLE